MLSPLIGPYSALTIVGRLLTNIPERTFVGVLVTGEGEEHKFLMRAIFGLILRNAYKELREPDNNDLDAPPISAPSDPGITLHYNGSLPSLDNMTEALSECFSVKKTAEVPEPIKAFYRKPHPSWRDEPLPENVAILWLAIGPGSPLTSPGACAR